MGFRVSQLPTLLIECCCLSLISCAVAYPLPSPYFVAAQVWYDNRADDLTKEGMLKGIEQAVAFVLFLSQGVLERPYCQLEIRHALALKKPVVLLHGESEEMRAMHDPHTTRS